MIASRMWPVLVVLQVFGACATEEVQEFHEEMEVSPSGEVGISSYKRNIIRRHDVLGQQAEIFAELEEGEQLYGVRDHTDRARKIESGTAYNGDPWAITRGPHTNRDPNSTSSRQARGIDSGASTGNKEDPLPITRGPGNRVPSASSSRKVDPMAVHVGPHSNQGRRRPFHNAPDWAPHASMPAMPACTQDVTEQMGISDYGSISHSCSACARDCTEENKQQATHLIWQFEPPLDSCNAFDVKLYANWSNIDQLGCADCEGKGVRHAFEVTISTNAGEGVKEYKDKSLGFEGWMGPEVLGGAKGDGSDFHGLHVFEMADTEEPSRSEDCDASNPTGRWISIPGGVRAGETHHCERVCKSSHPCNCGRNTHVRCTAAIAMSSNQVFSYRIRRVAESAMGTLDGNSYVGTEWEVTAEDLTQQSPVTTVGRVILAGNSASYGIKAMKQSHQHIGCVPCDLFYESTIVAGPFIEDPAGVHVVRSAEGKPPTLTAESCELFRISSVAGSVVKFESGPGLWPSFQVNDTIFTCSQESSINTCPIDSGMKG